MNLPITLFNDYWHLVCHRNELKNDGDYINFKTPIGDVVIFNDAMEIMAFDNRCAHRGTNIYPSGFGNQKNTCKYHGWSYQNGKLIIPQVENFDACKIKSAKLNTYKLDWCGDFLFLGVKPKTELYDQLNGVSVYLENISFNISNRYDQNAYQFECNWAIALENALEPYHIDLIHPNTLSTLKLDAGVNSYHGVNSVWKANVTNLKIEKKLKRIENFFNIDYSYHGYLSIFIFPFAMISSTFGYSYSIQNFFPDIQETNKTNFMSRLLIPNLKNEDSQKILDPFFKSTAAVNKMVFEEDHAICKLIPTDTWCDSPLLYASISEDKINHFRDSCRNSR